MFRECAVKGAVCVCVCVCVCEGGYVCVCEGGKACAFVRLCVYTCGSVTFVYVLCMVMFHACASGCV